MLCDYHGENKNSTFKKQVKIYNVNCYSQFGCINLEDVQTAESLYFNEIKITYVLCLIRNSIIYV